MESQELTVRTMKRIHRIYMLRKFLNPLTLKVYVLALMAIAASLLVSVPDIVRNASHVRNLDDFYTFSSFGITHTEIVVQVVVALGFAVLVWLGRDIVRSLRTSSMQFSL